MDPLGASTSKIILLEKIVASKNPRLRKFYWAYFFHNGTFQFFVSKHIDTFLNERIMSAILTNEKAPKLGTNRKLSSCHQFNVDKIFLKNAGLVFFIETKLNYKQDCNDSLFQNGYQNMCIRVYSKLIKRH